MAPRGFLAFVTVVAMFILGGEAFSQGAPASTCWTLYPKHSGHGTQTTDCPFVFTFSKQQFQPNDEITITISEPTGRTFIGIELGAHPMQINKEIFVGQFVSFPLDKIRAFNCFNGFNNMITHRNSESITSLSLTWRAPNKFVGDVKFRGTIVADYETFWVNVEHDLSSAPSAVPIPTVEYSSIPLNGLATDIDFSDCGDTKGCYFYPRHCSGDDCIAAATYQHRSASDDFLVELFTSEGPNYISFGLSDDQTMGGDATFTCTSRPGYISIQEGLNPGYFNDRQLTRSISGLQVRQKDGHTMCRFTMPSTIEVYFVNQSVEASSYTTQKYNSDKSWYLMLAWGKTMPESDVISHHEEMPATSISEVNIKSTDISYGSAFHIMIRVHVALMVVAWVLFTGIVTVMSRHYKDWLPNKRLCGTKVWFQIHREMAILVAILTTIGLLVIFAHFDWEITEFAVPHAYVGLSVAGCVGLQIIAGALRPNPEHKLRPIFNWGHFFLGQASHILAAATMYLAFDIDYVTPSMRKFGIITLSVWVAGQVLWHIIFEIISRRNKASGDGDNYNMDSGQSGADKSSKCGTLLLCLYIACLIAFCVAVMLSFLLF